MFYKSIAQPVYWSIFIVATLANNILGFIWMQKTLKNYGH